MRESTSEVIVGAAVLVAAFGFLGFIASTTGAGGSNPGLELSANFRSAEGVSVGTDVRLAGVSIGTVSALALNLQTYRADAVFSINEGVPIPDDSSAVVASEGLLGGTFVELIPGGSFEMLTDGGVIEDTQGAVSLIQLLLKFVGGSDA